MKPANKQLIHLILLMFVSTVGWTQSSDKLKKEQERLEARIANTKTLLGKTQTNTETSLHSLRLIENQIHYREQLLRNFDDQIRGAELTVQRKEQQIVALNERVKRLKEQYKKLLLFSYKNRGKYNKIMFIFTASSYFEARKRNAYLRRIADLQMKQFVVIQQNQKLIEEEIAAVKKEREYKLSIVGEKRKERAEIEKDRIRQKEVYQQFKAEEDVLLKQLRKEESERRNLQVKIQAAIQREIAEAEERRRKAEAEAKARESSTATSNNSANRPSATVVLKETKESAALSSSFAGNKGKLPWPVSKGTITEHFGKNAHPTLKNVYTNNGGVDISAAKNAQVRAVFEGEVTSVLNIPGAGKVVIIKHGNYRTVYSNLQDTYVTTGSKVSTQKIIGSLLAKDGQSLSVVHFEIHKVVGSTVTSLNPELWIAH